MSVDVDGFRIDISEEVLSNVKKVDKVLDEIKKKEPFKEMVSDIKTIVDKINSIPIALGNIKSPFTSMVSETTKIANNIASVVQGLSDVKGRGINISDGNTQKTPSNTKERIDAIKKETDALSEKAKVEKVNATAAKKRLEELYNLQLKLQKEQGRLQNKRDIKYVEKGTSFLSAKEEVYAKSLASQLLKVQKEINQIGTTYNGLRIAAKQAFDTKWIKAEADLAAQLERTLDNLIKKENSLANTRAKQATNEQASSLRAVRAEYEKNANYLERLNAALQRQSKILSTTKYVIDTRSTTLNEINRVQSRQQQLEAQNQGKLDDLISKHAAKRADIEMKAAEKVEREKLAMQQAYARRYLDVTRKWQARQEANAAKAQAAQLATPTGAINYAKQAATLNEMQKAYKNLQAVMSNTDPKSATWRQLNTVYAETKTRIDAVKKSMGDFNEQQSRAFNITGQLRNQLALMFSVAAIQNWVKHMTQVRAQFELQQIALRSILQDKEKADKVFAQVQQLALQSPFSIMQLNTYTKQVAAYGVEADKLVDTTKRLADVSAGLGVEMGRLTLAYGQVKTANYLRATEVRQFTEAGLNITQELANYFSELNGKMVTAGEVTEMITKRMVKFEDVAEVFRRVTSEGGMFYDMQRKQSEGLAGQMQRIGDAYSIMLNDIGKSNQGNISNILSAVRELIQNWRTVSIWVEKIGIGYLAFMAIQKRAIIIAGIQKLANMWSLLETRIAATSVAANASVFQQASALGRLSMLFSGATTAVRGLGLAMKAAFNATIVLAIVGALYEVTNYFIEAKAKADQLREALESIDNEISADTSKSISTYERLARVISDGTRSYEERKKAIDEMNRTFTDILPKEYLELSYIQQHAGNWQDAEKAMRSYYNAMALEKEKEAVMNAHRSEISEARKDIVNETITKAGQSRVDLGIDKGQLTGFVNEIIEQLKEGTITTTEEATAEYIRKIEEFTGKQLPQEFKKTFASDLNAGWSINWENFSDLADTMAEIRNETEGLTNAQKHYSTQQEADAAKAEAALNRHLEAVKGVTEQYINSLKDINAIGVQISQVELLPDSEEKNKKLQELQVNMTQAIESSKRLADAMGIAYPDYSKVAEDVTELSEAMKSGATSIADTFKNGANPALVEMYLSFKRLQDILKIINTGVEDGRKIDKRRADELKAQASQLKDKITADAKSMGREIKGNIYDIAKSSELIAATMKQVFLMTQAAFKKDVADRIVDYTNKMVLGMANAISPLLAAIGTSINVALSNDKGGKDDRSTTTTDKRISENSKLVKSITKANGAISSQKNLLMEAGQTVSDYTKNLKTLVETNEETTKSYDKAKDKSKWLSLRNMTESEIENLKRETKAARAIALEYDPTMFEKKSGGNGRKGTDTTEQDARNRFEFFKRANAEYEKLLKWYGKEEAKMRILNQMRAEAKALNIEGIFNTANFDDAGTIKAIEDVYNKIYASNKKHAVNIKQDMEKALSPIRVEIDFAIQQKELENIGRYFDELFGGYELYLELDKMGLDKSYMKDLFNIDVFSLDDIQKKSEEAFIDMINKQEKRRLNTEENTITTIAQAREKAGEEENKKYEENLKKQTEAFRKEVKERMKYYSKYLVQAYSEAGQIQLNALKDLEKISTLDVDENTKDLFRRGVMRDTQEALDKQVWADFKADDLYVQMFENLDKVSMSALKAMKERLEEIRNSLKNLSPTELKDIQTQYEKLDTAIRERNPFKDLGESLKTLFTAHKDVKRAKAELEEYTQKLDELKNKRAELEQRLQFSNTENKEKILADTEAQISTNKKRIEERKAAGVSNDDEQITALEEQNRKLEQQVILWKEIIALQNTGELSLDVEDTKDKLNDTNDAITSVSKQQKNAADNASKFQKALTNAAKAIGGINSQVQSIGAGLNNFKSVFEDAFGEMSDGMQDFFDDMNYTLGGLDTLATGVAQIASGDYIGGALNAAAGLFQTIGGLFGVGSHDKKREREIQNQIKAVERLGRAYEKLEKQIQDAYSFNQLSAGTKQAQENLRRQNERYQAMIAAEKGKKKTDWKRVQEWQDAIDDNLEKIEELQRDWIDEMGGLASGDRIKSTADSFVNTWLEAYKETGDGLSGLEEEFDNFFAELFKKQVISIIGENYISKLKDSLNKALETDNKIDEAEWAALAREWQQTLPEMNEALKEAARLYEQAMGKGLDEDTRTSLSTLSKGIQGVTEDTAHVVEAILNSMRYFVSDTNMQVREIKSAILNPPSDNAFLAEMRMQTAELRAINSLLKSVTRGGHPQGGEGLKVFID